MTGCTTQTYMHTAHTHADTHNGVDAERTEVPGGMLHSTEVRFLLAVEKRRSVNGGIVRNRTRHNH